MANACRDAVIGWNQSAGSNPGLIRDRFLQVAVKDKNDHPEARRQLFGTMCQSLTQLFDVYPEAFHRYKSSLRKPIAEGTFRTNGRMVIGLGGENVLETGLTLHHTYGTPVIPGTALKGLTAHYCNQAWGAKDSSFKNAKEPEGKYFRAIFGTTNDSGHIIFHDAWITPDSLEGSLQPDVMTPHHGDYYSGKAAPTDFDDPNPVTFLSVMGTFHVAISCDVTGEQGEMWAKLVFEMLTEALNEWGIGGKTNAGYGRLVRSTGESRVETKINAATNATTTCDTSKKQVAAKVAEQKILRPLHRKGDVIEVTREADPNIRRGKPYFRADDGFGGFIQFGSAPSLQIGQKTRLEISGVMNEGYVFAIPGLKEDYLRNKGNRGRR